MSILALLLFYVRNCCFCSLSLFSRCEMERSGKWMPTVRTWGGILPSYSERNHTGWSQRCRKGERSDLARLRGNGGHHPVWCRWFRCDQQPPVTVCTAQRNCTPALLAAFKSHLWNKAAALHVARSAASSLTWCDLSHVSHSANVQALKELSSAALAPLKNTQWSRNQHSQRDFFYDF